MTTLLVSNQLDDVGWLNTAIHEGGSTRMCVHLLDKKPPQTFVVGVDSVARLNYQTRVIVHEPPVIAGRIGDVLIVGFDQICPLILCSKHRRKGQYRLAHRFHYRLSSTHRSDTLLATRIK